MLNLRKIVLGMLAVSQLISGNALAEADFSSLEAQIKNVKTATGLPTGTSIIIIKDDKVVYSSNVGYADIALQSSVRLYGIGKKYQLPIQHFLRRLTAGEPDIADDIAQETFIRVYRKLDSYKGEASFTTWLHKIAYHCFLRSQQKQYLHREIQGIDLSEFETEMANTDKDILIEQLMKMLSSNERTCLTLSVSVGLTHDEICGVTELPLGTVKSHIARGKSKLLKAVEGKA